MRISDWSSDVCSSDLFLQGRDIKSCARFKATTDQLRAQEVIGSSSDACIFHQQRHLISISRRSSCIFITAHFVLFGKGDFKRPARQSTPVPRRCPRPTFPPGGKTFPHQLGRASVRERVFTD